MKILLLDIETAPNLVHVWGLWQQNVGINQIMAAGYTLCYAAKWYKEKPVMFDSVFKSEPKDMIQGVHSLLDEADAVVHFNGRKFDIPTLNKEFVMYGMAPPSPYKQIDLLQTSRSQFKFPSNKLDYVSQQLGLGSKVKHMGHELWVKCMAGDAKAWKEMEKYNKQDVVLLESLYDRFMPWIKSHPNHSLYESIECCINCGSNKLQKRGYARTQAGTYERFQCQSCGRWMKGRTNIAERKHILSGDN